MTRRTGMSTRLLVVAMGLGCALVACGGEGVETELAGGAEAATQEALAAASPETPLAGSAWRLLHFQSMDDSVGTIEPQASQVYTLRLNADGTVNMELNCNRATGSWSVEPSADGRSGGFHFGPLAATRALCPPPSLDERIVADAQYVAGYLLRNDNLYLSLMADAGIYAWEPLATAAESAEETVPFDTAANRRLEDALREVSPDYTQDLVEVGGGQARYLHAQIDLNGDGRPETFAYLLGSFFCGTGGCNLLLFTDEAGGYRLVDEFPITDLPVIVSAEENEGWRDLYRLETGGGAKPSYVRHAFDGENYPEVERLPVDPAPSGTPVMAGEFTFQDGLELEPHD